MPERPLPIEFLRGKRVILRPVLREDIPLLLKWVNDPDVSQFVMNHLPFTELDEEQWLSGLSNRKGIDLIFIVLADGRPIGTMGIHNVSWRDRTATTGSMIGEKEYWGRGYGTEAKMLLLNYAFRTLNLRKICSSVIEYNRRSQRALEKCGYVIEGRRKKQIFRKGRYWDEILFAVYRKNWSSHYGSRTLP